MEIGELTSSVHKALSELLSIAELKPENILVIGCSTSEVLGKKIGSASNLEVAKAIMEGIEPLAKKFGLFLAVQCCEHLNRALVVEEDCAVKYDLEVVTVLPHLEAGGAFAVLAYEEFAKPVVVESIQGHAGMDIGDTMIGMHLKRVAVPVRSEVKRIGEANLVMARTRPKLIGGERAKYPPLLRKMISYNVGTVDIALINMPFASFRQPSFALGLLKSSIKDKLKVKVFDFNVYFAEKIGADLYDKIATWHIVDLLGDRLFAQDLYGDQIPPFEEYVDKVLNGNLEEHEAPYDKKLVDYAFYNELLEVQKMTNQFLEECSRIIIQANPKIVAFTNMFHQQTSSLALAKRLKKVLSRVLVAFGGANCKGPMGVELITHHAFIDCLCLGEGDSSFKKLVNTFIDDQAIETLSNIPGMIFRKDVEGDNVNPFILCSQTLEMDLNLVPTPDYDDFAQLCDERKFMHNEKPRVFFEMSRGCYWGQKKRCIFCGQSSETLIFRKKNHERIVTELRKIVNKYPAFALSASDESVDERTLEALIEALSTLERKPEIVYLQVRPDIDVKMLEKLAACGLKRLEVGIESLSSNVLSIIGKGVNGLQNITFLKNCREAGVKPIWNFLWGFPKEPESSYENMANLIPLLTHLHPPNYAGPFRLDRFSPCFENPYEHGIRAIKPYPSYRFVYPFNEEVIDNFASFFTFKFQTPQNVKDYTCHLQENIFFWKEIYPKSALYYRQDLVIDRRSGIDEWHIRLDPLTMAVCKASSEPVTLQGIAQRLKEVEIVKSEEEIRQSIKNLIKYGILLKEKEMYLSLVTEEKEVMP